MDQVIGVPARSRVPIRVIVLLVVTAAATIAAAHLEDPEMAEVLPLIVIFAGLRLAPVFLESRPDLFSPLIYGGLTATIGTLAVVLSMLERGVVLNGFPALDAAERIDLAQRTAFLGIVAILAYYAGYAFGPHRGFARRLPEVAGLVWQRRRVTLMVIGTLLIFLVAYIAFQVKLGLPLLEFTQLGAGKAIWRNDPTLSWMLRGIQIGFLPLLLLLAWTLRRGSMPAMAAAAGLVGFASLLLLRTAMRGSVALLLIGAVVLFHYLRRRIPVWAFVVAYVVGILASNAVYEWRRLPSGTERELSMSQFLQSPRDALVSHETERSRFSVEALVVHEFPERTPYLMGKSYVAWLVLPVPRWLWPEKAAFGAWRDNNIAQMIAGIPAPSSYHAALYANFSWVGVVLGMFLFGAFHRGLHAWLLMHRGDLNVTLLYVMLLLWFSPTTLGLSHAMQFVLLLWLILRFIGRRASTRASAAAPSPA